MDTDNTLFLMGQYDFNKPVDVTITFEDSDNENDPCNNTIEQNVQAEESVNETNVLNSSKLPNPNSYELPSLQLINSEVHSSVNMNNESISLRAKNAPHDYQNNNHCQDGIMQGTQKDMEKSSDKNLQQPIVNNATSSNENGIIGSKSKRNKRSNKQKIIDNKMSNYLQRFLNDVSHNVLRILKAYRCYIEILKDRTNTKSIIQSSYEYYMRVKYHFFKLSYGTLTILFLPEVKNKNFNKNFITETLKIAHKEGFNCTYTELECIYSEMMKWLKVNFEKVINVPLHNMYTSNNRQQRRECPSSKTNSIATRQSQPPPPYRDPKVRNIFSSGPPGREIQIAVDQRFDQSSTNAYNTDPSTQFTGSNEQMYATYESGNASNSHNYNYLLTLRNELNDSVPIHNNNDYLQNYSNTTFTSIPSRPPTYGTDQAITENYGILISDVRTENPKQMPPVNYRRISTTDQTNIRSSISRDSGIISPPNFNSAAGQTCNMNDGKSLEYFDLRIRPPEINFFYPDGSLIKPGFCNTCSKNTNTKCVRCYKTYYCSILCVTIDWASHINMCNVN